jgi:5-methylcytosine-specific restriction enzyme A
MALSEDLRPTGRNRVIDLVRAAGVDVSDWGNFSRGPSFAAVNPKYCYEWSFVDSAAGIVVLNLWFRNIKQRRGIVSAATNMRAASKDMSRQGSKGVWIARAAKMDDAIRFAWESKARVRVIVNDGDMRKANDAKAKAAVVRRRLLDPLPWTIVEYVPTTGACTLVRGVVTAPKVDQFDVSSEAHGDPERRDVHGMPFVRNPAVRAAVLSRATGRCEFCGTPGFVTSQGEVFLETHHIVPLSEGGADSTENTAAVCPNHHREAHHGVSAAVIRDFLIKVAEGK